MTEQDKLIIDMFVGGVSMRKIAEHFGCTHNKISSLLRQYGYTSNYRHKLNEGEICREYLEDSDISATGLAAKYNCSNGTILRILRKHDVPLKQAHQINIELDEAAMVAMYVEERESANDIASMLGVNPQVIQKRLRKNGIELRTNSECHQKWFVNEEFFNEIDSPEKAYWLGMLFADGFVSSNLRDFGLTLMRSDRDHIEKFAKAIEYTGEIFDESGEGEYGYRESSRIVPASRASCQYLISHGVVPRKTHITEAPINLSEEFNKDFIRGVVDGDGGIYVYDKMTSLEIVGDHGLLNWIAKQGPSDLTAPQVHKSIWRVRSFTKNAHEWIKWLYEDAEDYLDRKYARAMTVIERGF